MKVSSIFSSATVTSAFRPRRAVRDAAAGLLPLLLAACSLFPGDGGTCGIAMAGSGREPMLRRLRDEGKYLDGRTTKQRPAFFLGAAAFLVIWLFTDLEPGKPEVSATLAVASLMAIWWVSETVPLAITALVPIVLFPALGILDGKAVAAELRREAGERAASLAAEHGVTPGLTVVLVGDDPASSIYVRNKHQDCQKVGIESAVVKLPADTTSEALKAEIDRINHDDGIDGLIVQLPVPDHIDPADVRSWIAPQKDVDGLNPENVGLLVVLEVGEHRVPGAVERQ